MSVRSRILPVSPSLFVSRSHYCILVTLLQTCVLFIGATLTPAGESDTMNMLRSYIQICVNLDGETGEGFNTLQLLNKTSNLLCFAL